MKNKITSLKGLLLIISIGLVHPLDAQIKSSLWFFGDNAGIDFSKTPPIATSYGKTNSSEGVATISNEDGSLLFYSDGKNVYNRENKLMKNGSGLIGQNGSSAQSPIIVQDPGNNNYFYLFYIGDDFTPSTQGQLRYSVVNMCADSGRGELILGSRNTLIASDLNERLSCRPMANGDSFWLITSKIGTHEFYAYKITKNGINTTPVKTDFNLSCGGLIALAKFNHIGTKMAYTNTFKTACNGVWVVDFDSTTGKFSNRISVENNTEAFYDVVFSPDNKLLYYTDVYQVKDPSKVSQYDFNTKAITVLKSITGNYRFCGLNIAPDGKIYVSENGVTKIHTIDKPNVSGTGCNFNYQSFTLVTGTMARLGMQNETYYYKKLDIIDTLPNLKDTIICEGDNLVYTTGLDITQWSDGSTGKSIQISKPGKYWARLVYCSAVITDTFEVIVKGKNGNFLGIDTSICKGGIITLTGLSDSTKWNTGETSKKITITNAGKYWAQDKSICGLAADTLEVKNADSTLTIFPNDTSICLPITLTFNVQNDSSFWDNGTIPFRQYQITNGGFHYVQQHTSCAILYDTFYINEKYGTESFDIRDTSFCDNQGILNINSPFIDSFYWWDSTTDYRKSFQTEGFYSLSKYNQCDTFTDNFEIKINKLSDLKLGLDTSICDPFNYTLGFKDGNSFLWNTGETSNFIKITKAGLYFVSYNSVCGLIEDSIFIKADTAPFAIPKEVLICGEINYPLDVGIANVLWDGQLQSRPYIVKQQGIYQMYVSNGCGEFNQQIEIKRGYSGMVLIPNAFTPNGDLLNEKFPHDTLSFPFHMEIYNRWGEKLFEGDNQLWDGNYKNVLCQEGVYLYLIWANECGRIKSYKGTFHLMR